MAAGSKLELRCSSSSHKMRFEINISWHTKHKATVMEFVKLNYILLCLVGGYNFVSKKVLLSKYLLYSISLALFLVVATVLTFTSYRPSKVATVLQKQV
jgi:hypothetical protein